MKKKNKGTKKGKKSHKKHYKAMGGTNWAAERAEWETNNA